jgi:ankyrin repeat protein
MNKNEKALFQAVRNGELSNVITALQNGASIEAKESYGDTALNLAAENGHIDIVKHLVEAGANIENLGGAAKTPVMNAAFAGHGEIVIFLIGKGAKISNDLLSSVQMKVNILEENAEAGMVTQEGVNAWKEFLNYLIAERQKQDAGK